MMQDLATLAPSLIVCAAFLWGVWALVRRELAPKRQHAAARREGGQAARADADETARMRSERSEMLYIAYTLQRAVAELWHTGRSPCG